MSREDKATLLFMTLLMTLFMITGFIGLLFGVVQ